MKKEKIELNAIVTGAKISIDVSQFKRLVRQVVAETTVRLRTKSSGKETRISDAKVARVAKMLDELQNLSGVSGTGQEQDNFTDEEGAFLMGIKNKITRSFPIYLTEATKVHSIYKRKLHK